MKTIHFKKAKNYNVDDFTLTFYNEFYIKITCNVCHIPNKDLGSYHKDQNLDPVMEEHTMEHHNWIRYEKLGRDTDD